MRPPSFASAYAGAPSEIPDPNSPRRRGRCLRGLQWPMIGLNHAPVGEDLGDVILRLRDARYAADRANAPRSGVVCRKRQIDAPEFLQLPTEIARCAAKVSVKTVAIDPELLRRSRHELTEPERALRTDRDGIV